MDNRIALLGIIIEQPDSVEQLNAILHDYNQYVVGRMGLPYRQRGVSIISIVLDAPTNIISALSGKVGMLSGVTAKAVYSKMPEESK